MSEAEDRELVKNFMGGLALFVKQRDEDQKYDAMISELRDKEERKMKAKMENAHAETKQIKLLAFASVSAILLGLYGIFLFSCIANNVDWFWKTTNQAQHVLMTSTYEGEKISSPVGEVAEEFYLKLMEENGEAAAWEQHHRELAKDPNFSGEKEMTFREYVNSGSGSILHDMGGSDIYTLENFIKMLFLGSNYYSMVLVALFVIIAWAGYHEFVRVFVYAKVNCAGDDQASMQAGLVMGTGRAILGVTAFFIGFTLVFPILLMLSGGLIVFMIKVCGFIGSIPLFFGNLFGIDGLYNLGVSMWRQVDQSDHVIEAYPIVAKTTIAMAVALSTLMGLVLCGYKGVLALIGLAIDIVLIAMKAGFGPTSCQFTKNISEFIPNPTLDAVYSTALLPIRLICMYLFLTIAGMMLHPMTPDLPKEPEAAKVKVIVEVRKECIPTWYGGSDYTNKRYDTDECYDDYMKYQYRKNNDTETIILK